MKSTVNSTASSLSGVTVTEPSSLASIIGEAGGVLSTLLSLPAVVSELELPLPLLFSASTFDPSFTASGSIVTLPVSGSTVTPGGNSVPSFGVHSPVVGSFSISTFCGWSFSSVKSTVASVASLDGVISTAPSSLESNTGASGGKSKPAVTSEPALPLSLLFSPLTCDSSFTASGAMVTFPVSGSTETPGGKSPSDSHLPVFGSFSILTVWS